MGKCQHGPPRTSLSLSRSSSTCWLSTLILLLGSFCSSNYWLFPGSRTSTATQSSKRCWDSAKGKIGLECVRGQSTTGHRPNRGSFYRLLLLLIPALFEDRIYGTCQLDGKPFHSLIPRYIYHWFWCA